MYKSEQTGSKSFTNTNSVQDLSNLYTIKGNEGGTSVITGGSKSIQMNK